MNVTAPRRGAFEIIVTNSHGVGMAISVKISWSSRKVTHLYLILFSRDYLMEWP